MAAVIFKMKTFVILLSTTWWMFWQVVVYGTDTVTVTLLNSTGIGSAQPRPLGCPCTLNFFITLTDSSTCACSPQPSNCKQCHVVVTNTTNLNIDTGQGGNCVINNTFTRKTNLHLGVDVTQIGNKGVILANPLMQTFCQLIDMNKRKSLYSTSGGRNASLLLNVTLTSATTTTTAPTTTNKIHPRMTSTSSKPTTFTNNTSSTGQNGDASLSTGAIVGIVMGVIAVTILVTLVACYIKHQHKKL